MHKPIHAESVGNKCSHNVNNSWHLTFVFEEVHTCKLYNTCVEFTNPTAAYFSEKKAISVVVSSQIAADAPPPTHSKPCQIISDISEILFFILEEASLKKFII